MSYINLNYHLIFSTKDRRPLIGADLMPRLREYMGGIVRDLGGRMLIAGGAPDHIHIATVLDQKTALMEVLKQVKAGSSEWVHQTVGKSDFGWQDGYAAFSVSHSAMPQVVAYIQGQAEHHRKRSFQEELIEFLKKHEVTYDERPPSGGCARPFGTRLPPAKSLRPFGASKGQQIPFGADERYHAPFGAREDH